MICVIHARRIVSSCTMHGVMPLRVVMKRMCACVFAICEYASVNANVQILYQVSCMQQCIPCRHDSHPEAYDVTVSDKCIVMDLLLLLLLFWLLLLLWLLLWLLLLSRGPLD
ncbi:unnamed protein product [Polarella glacialis]|uniref:Uncharacterized protein n=1 Tax=Polarella glacialis TaxID=89957 RepID=A0A813FE84_POLGL|nr:unnamed protein product [Polarella glacialis]